MKKSYFKIIAIIGTLLLLTLFLRERKLSLLLMGFLGYYFFFYYSLQRQIRSLRVRRRTPEKGQERDEITAHYQVLNFSSFPIHDFILEDYFTGSEQLLMKKSFSISSHQQKTLRENFILNAGMGKKSFHSLKATLSDPLGIFKIERIFGQEKEFDVYPLIEGPSQIKAITNSYSYHFGEIDLAEKGESTNFMGVREYRPGDAIKKMNWRQTFKHQRAIVNIYEKNVNKTFTLLLNRDFRLHSGEGAESTFEYLKDELLSLACEHIKNGNQIKVVTNGLESPLGAGSGFIKELEKFIFSLELVKDESPQYLIRRQMKSTLSLSQKDDSFIYFTPILPGPLYTNNMEDLIRLRKQGREVHVVWVNAFPFLHRLFPFGGHFSVSSQLESTAALEKEWKKKCYQNKVEYLAYSLGRADD